MNFESYKLMELVRITDYRINLYLDYAKSHLNRFPTIGKDL